MQLREFTRVVSCPAGVLVVASDGGDGVICVGGVWGTEEDRVYGAVCLRHVQDLWSTGSCSSTDRKGGLYTNVYLTSILKTADLIPVSCV